MFTRLANIDLFRFFAIDFLFNNCSCIHVKLKTRTRFSNKIMLQIPQNRTVYAKKLVLFFKVLQCYHNTLKFKNVCALEQGRHTYMYQSGYMLLNAHIDLLFS